MISSADEFRTWWASPRSAERLRALRAPVADDVLTDVVRRFPECRADVAWRRETPIELLAELRADEDEGVRWRVRSNKRWLDEHPEDARPWDDDPSLPIQFRLDDDERRLLREGLSQWHGPAQCTDELAVAMGFASRSDLFDDGARIGATIAAGRPLSRTDWARALFATEVVFASTVMGAAWDWHTVTGIDDDTTLRLLRSLQRKIRIGGVVGVTLGTLPPESPPVQSAIRAR